MSWPERRLAKQWSSLRSIAKDAFGAGGNDRTYRVKSLVRRNKKGIWSEATHS